MDGWDRNLSQDVVSCALKGEINEFFPQDLISLERSPKHLSSEYVHPVEHEEMLLILLKYQPFGAGNFVNLEKGGHFISCPLFIYFIFG